MEDRAQFSFTNYVVLCCMLSISIGIGAYFAVAARNKKTRVEYLLGGRQMGALPVCLSLFATFQSAISLLGNPTEIYTYGTMKIYDNIGISFTFLAALATSVALFYPLRITSVNEYLLLRFESSALRKFGAAIGVISTVSFMTTALLSPALALETVIGIPLWLSIILVGAIGTLYTTLGGIKSVIWTDVFQSSIIFSGIVVVLIKSCFDTGGVGKAWEEIQASGRLEFDNVDLDPRTRHTIWGLTFGMFWFWLSFHFSQSCVQRIVSIRSLREAKLAYTLWLPLNLLYVGILSLLGLVMVAYFRFTRCDPLEAGYITNKNQLVPYLVIDTLSFLPGLSGLYISTIFSGALSTLSSGINSLAANTVEDFLSFAFRGKSEGAVTTITKVTVCLYGALVIFLTYFIKEFQGPVTQINYTAIGASNGPLLGMFLLGGIFPQANYVGAFAGCISGLVVSWWQAIGSFMYGQPTPTLPPGPTDRCSVTNSTIMTYSNTSDQQLTTFQLSFNSTIPETQPIHHSSSFSAYDLSYLWNPMIGVTVTVVVGLFTSLVSNRYMKRKLVPDPKHIFPFCRRFWFPSTEEDVTLNPVQS